MDPNSLRTLIEEAVGSAQDADSTGVTAATLYTPLRHKSALLKDVTVVVGSRGVGKTIWYESLLNDSLRKIAARTYQIPELEAYTVYRGFGNKASSDYPSSRVLVQLIQSVPSSDDHEEIWTTVLLHGLGWSPLSECTTWAERLKIVLDDPEGYEAFLRATDESAAAAGKVHLFMFDGLDRLSRDRKEADRLSSMVLRVGLAVRLAYTNIRIKIFIRPDMYESADKTFPDASKLDANRADLRWDVIDLYGMFFQRLGNGGAPSLAESFRVETGRWESRESHWIPPRGLMSDTETQKHEFSVIAGDYMGANHRRGYTYTWLPNHLADGLGQTSPRSFMTAIQKAAQISFARYGTHSHSIHWDALREGVREASEVRVNEIYEDIEWVRAAVSPLKGMQVPMDRLEVFTRWDAEGVPRTLEDQTSTSDDSGRPTGPSSNTLDGIFADLVQLGILTQRSNGKLDMPDVYRIAFGLGRKGGVPGHAQR